MWKNPLLQKAIRGKAVEKKWKNGLPQMEDNKYAALNSANNARKVTTANGRK